MENMLQSFSCICLQLTPPSCEQICRKFSIWSHVLKTFHGKLQCSEQFINTNQIALITEAANGGCSARKDVLRNFAKFTGEFAKFLRTPFL